MYILKRSAQKLKNNMLPMMLLCMFGYLLSNKNVKKHAIYI